MFLKKIWRRLIERGHERTVRAKRNIVSSVLFKGLGMLIGFIYFPISLSYLGEAKFGIFIALSSMIDWFVELDLGIGNGLRNRLGESIADKDDEAAKGYISTAYFVLGSIFSGVSVIFMAVSFFLPWADWLQANPALNSEIAFLAMLMFAAFAIRFVSSLVYQIFFALQRVAMVDLFSFFTKFSFLIIIVVVVYFTEDSLILFGAAKTFTFAMVPFLVGIYFYRNKFKNFRPSWRYVHRSYFKGLFSLGIQFFLIKSSMIVIHQTNNFLIAGFVALEAVPQYEAAYKYLSIFMMLFLILTNQLWSANIEAYRKGELDWMRKSMKTVAKIWVGTVLIASVMVIASPFFYKFWFQVWSEKNKMNVSMLITATVALSICTTTWVNMFNLVLNGAGKIRLQMYAWIVAAIANIPVSIFFVKVLGMGVEGIVLGTVVSLIPLVILSPIQVLKILSGTDKGIWSK